MTLEHSSLVAHCQTPPYLCNPFGELRFPRVQAAHNVAFISLDPAASSGKLLRRSNRAGRAWSGDAPMYWLVSLPLLDDSEERAWTLVQNRTTYESDLSSNYKFVLPELRVGTLDSLMVLSDDLVKVNGLVESVVNKVRRQLFEMGAVNGSDTQEARPCPPAVNLDPY